MGAAYMAQLSGRVARAESKLRGRLVILMYHRVLPDAEARAYPLPSLAMPLTAFREQAGWMAAHHTVLPLRDAHGRMGESSAVALVSVTFDDGYADSYRYAAPVLEAAGVRGAPFVTGAVESRALPWYDAVLAACDRFDGKTVLETMAAHEIERRPESAFQCVQLLEQCGPGRAL